MGRYSDSLGCVIPIVVLLLKLSAWRIIPRTESWEFQKMNKENSIHGCMAYINKHPEGEHIETALESYVELVRKSMEKHEYSTPKQSEVSALAKRFASCSSYSLLKDLSDDLVQSYMQNNPETEEYWKHFKDIVDEDSQHIADEHLSSISSAWDSEEGALSELMKYSHSQDNVKTSDDRDLLISKYEKYLEAFPDGACSDSIWKQYALCLKESLTYMEDHYISEDYLEDLMKELEEY